MIYFLKNEIWELRDQVRMLVIMGGGVFIGPSFTKSRPFVFGEMALRRQSQEKWGGGLGWPVSPPRKTQLPFRASRFSFALVIFTVMSAWERKHFKTFFSRRTDILFIQYIQQIKANHACGLAFTRTKFTASFRKDSEKTPWLELVCLHVDPLTFRPRLVGPETGLENCPLGTA